MSVEVGNDFRRHLQQTGAGQDEFTSEAGECMAERVNGTAVAKVARKDDFQAVQSAVGLLNGEEVEHGLRGVVSCSIASVKDGHPCSILGVLGRALTWMSHGDDIGVAVHHLDGVKQCLAFDHGGGLHVTEVDHISTKTLHGGFKRHPSSCARFKEEVTQNFPLE